MPDEKPKEKEPKEVPQKRLARPDDEFARAAGVPGGNEKEPVTETKFKPPPELVLPELPSSSDINPTASHIYDTRMDGPTAEDVKQYVGYCMENNHPEQLQTYLNHHHYRPEMLDEQFMIAIYKKILWEDFPIDVFDLMKNIILECYDENNKCVQDLAAAKLRTALFDHIESRLNMKLLNRDLKYPYAKEVETEAFLMFVLFQRKDAALMFMLRSDNPIGAALIACALLKESMAIATKCDEYHHANVYKEMHSFFEGIAVKSIDRCYQLDNIKALHLLIRKLPYWNDTTLFSISDSLEAMGFMATAACQVRLTQIWNGYFLYSKTRGWKYPVGVLAPAILMNEGNNFARTIKNKWSTQEQEVGSTSINEQTNVNASANKQTKANTSNEKQTDKLLKYKVDKWYPTSKNAFRKGFHVEYKNMIQQFTFFYSTPRTKLFSHGLSYVTYLILFAYFINADISSSSPRTISVTGYLVWTWSFTMFLDEIREMCTAHPQYKRPPWRHYFGNQWNRMDMVSHILMFVSICSHLYMPTAGFSWARQLYVATFLLTSFRMIHIFYASPTIGPLAVMFQNMLDDIWKFVFLLLLFMVAFGVALQALKFPSTAPSGSLLVNIIYYPYWSIFGENFSDDNGKVLAKWVIDNCTNNETLHRSAPDVYPRCPEDSWMAELLLAGYMFITNVLLLNLLIAMFSNTYQKIQQESEKYWRYHRHQLVLEYYDKPALAPPLSIFYNIYFLGKRLLDRIKGIDQKDTPFYRDFDRLKRIDGYAEDTDLPNYEDLSKFEMGVIKELVEDEKKKRTDEANKSKQNKMQKTLDEVLQKLNDIQRTPSEDIPYIDA